jgi:hypothetical protein
MKKPSNKVIAVYLTWVLVHATLWVIALPSQAQMGRFYPFAHDRLYMNGDSFQATPSFQIDRVYDITEFLFYTIAPILIYYIITLFNSPKD